MLQYAEMDGTLVSKANYLIRSFLNNFYILHVDTWDIPIDMLLFPDITLMKGLFMHTGLC